MNWAHSDFVERYRPLVYLISSETDIDVLAAEPGYTRNVGLRMRVDRHQSLRDYAVRLNADFQALYKSAYQQALIDTELAADLARAQRDLTRVLTAINLHVRLSRLIPIPGPRKKRSIVRSIMLNLIPRISVASELLHQMHSIQSRTTGQTPYLP